jgi:hypothetical protein
MMIAPVAPISVTGAFLYTAYTGQKRPQKGRHGVGV